MARARHSEEITGAEVRKSSRSHTRQAVHPRPLSMVCVRGMRVRVCECGAENKAKQQNARFSSSSDSVCRYNCLFNIATPYYATFYDLLVRACSLNSTFLSNDRSLTCFITGK